MFAINIGVMFEKGVAKSHDYVLWRSVYFDFKVYFSLFLHVMSTVDDNKVVTDFGEFVITYFILFDVGRIWIGFELKDLAILMAFAHEFTDPVAMSLSLAIPYPFNLHFVF